jgi:hypothetical protein
MTKRQRKYTPPRKYTPEQRQFFIEYVPGHSHKEITEEFNRRFNDNIEISRVKAYIANHKLNTGRTGRFEKGNIPWSKGRKMSPEQYEKCKGTMFKAGERSKFREEVGTENVDKYGYTWVKVSDYQYDPVNPRNNWKMKQRLIYEQAYGPIPEGVMIVFLDGNKQNFDLDNLAPVTASTICRMNQNGLFSEDPEATKSGIVVAELITKISELERGKKKNE